MAQEKLRDAPNTEVPLSMPYVRTSGRYSVLAASTKIPHHSNGNMTMLFFFLTVTDRMKAAGKIYQGSSPVESEVQPPCSLSNLLLKEECSHGWIQSKSQTWPTLHV